MSEILIIGAGGHSKIIADIFLLNGATVVGFLDDDSKTWGRCHWGIPVLGPISSYPDHDPEGVILGVGSNNVRARLADMLNHWALGKWRNAIHPSAVVASSAKLGQGVVVAAGGIINPDTVVGDHVIVNTGATLDHDCIIDDYVHIAPGTHIAGGVRVETGALLGIGSSVIPNQIVGAWSTVGAGAVVVTEIPARTTVVGAPAREKVQRPGDTDLR